LEVAIDRLISNTLEGLELHGIHGLRRAKIISLTISMFVFLREVFIMRTFEVLRRSSFRMQLALRD
jgi:hypothetical protein